MPADSTDSLRLLEEARRGAQRVLEVLLLQQQALTSSGRAGGVHVVEEAIEAARRTLGHIEADLQAASTSDPTDIA